MNTVAQPKPNLADREIIVGSRMFVRRVLFDGRLLELMQKYVTDIALFFWLVINILINPN